MQINKYVFLFSLIFYVLTVQSKNHKNLCVQTLNTYGMFYADNVDERHSQTLEFLKENSCDVILLQEVWYEDHRTNLEQLSDDLEMSGVYFDHFDSEDRRSGLMGLVRGQVRNNTMQFFPDYVSGLVEAFFNYLKNISKGFGVLHVEYPEFQNNPFLITNIHLDNISQIRRLQSLLLYLKWIVDNTFDHQSSIITAGDFNCEPGSLEFDALKYMFRFTDPYEQIEKERHCTFSCSDSGNDLRHFFFGDRILDHIFYKPSPNIAITPQDVKVFPRQYNDTSLSDHYGVRALLNIEERHNFTPGLLAEEEIQERIEQFESTLNRIELLMLENDEELSVFDRDLIQFFRMGLVDSDSSVYQYLRI